MAKKKDFSLSEGLSIDTSDRGLGSGFGGADSTALADQGSGFSLGGMFSNPDNIMALARGVDDYTKRRKADKINRFETAAGQFGKSDTLAKHNQGVGGFNPLAQIAEEKFRRELKSDRDLTRDYLRQKLAEKRGSLKNVAEKSGVETADKKHAKEQVAEKANTLKQGKVDPATGVDNSRFSLINPPSPERDVFRQGSFIDGDSFLTSPNIDGGETFTPSSFINDDSFGMGGK